MSNYLVGNGKLPEQIPVLGKPGTYGKVDVDVKSLINRTTKLSVIRKYLKSGFDYNKFTPPIIAIFPNDREVLLDGDHRRAMFKVAFPRLKKMPCYRINVADEKEYHRLFIAINWSNRKTANKEEVFVHEVLACDHKALQTVSDLKKAGLSIFGSPEPHGTVGAKDSPNTTVGAFRNAMKYGINNVSNAVKVISTAWPSSTKVQGEFLEAISLLYSLYPDLSNGSAIATDFEHYIETVVGVNTMPAAASDYKTRGGRVHHKHAESIAKGIIDHWRTSNLSSRGGCSVRHKQKKISVKLIANKLL